MQTLYWEHGDENKILDCNPRIANPTYRNNWDYNFVRKGVIFNIYKLKDFNTAIGYDGGGPADKKEEEKKVFLISSSRNETFIFDTLELVKNSGWFKFI